MLTDIYPVRWTGRQAVIALPEHIDVSNAGPIREELLSQQPSGSWTTPSARSATPPSPPATRKPIPHPETMPGNPARGLPGAPGRRHC